MRIHSKLFSGTVDKPVMRRRMELSSDLYSNQAVFGQPPAHWTAESLQLHSLPAAHSDQLWLKWKINSVHSWRTKRKGYLREREKQSSLTHAFWNTWRPEHYDYSAIVLISANGVKTWAIYSLWSYSSISLGSYSNATKRKTKQNSSTVSCYNMKSLLW